MDNTNSMTPTFVNEKYRNIPYPSCAKLRSTKPSFSTLQILKYLFNIFGWFSLVQDLKMPLVDHIRQKETLGKGNNQKGLLLHLCRPRGCEDEEKYCLRPLLFSHCVRWRDDLIRQSKDEQQQQLTRRYTGCQHSPQ